MDMTITGRTGVDGPAATQPADVLATPVFDWMMVPVAALADAFFGMLHMRLPDYVRTDPRLTGQIWGPAPVPGTAAPRL
jgi:hypothetical protein